MDKVFAVIVVGTMVGIAAYLIGSLFRAIAQQRRTSNIRRIWHNFALSISFAILFILSWAAQGIAEWQRFTDQQRSHGEPVEVGDFLLEFSQSTLENWQSEFLQLFSFVVLSALFIHHGSAESKDSDDRMERKIEEILERVRG